MNKHEISNLYQVCRLGISGELLASVLFDEINIIIPCNSMTLLWRRPTESTVRIYNESETELDCGFSDVKCFNDIFNPSNLELFSLIEPENQMLKQIARVMPSIFHVIEKNSNTLVVYFTNFGERIGAILLHRSNMEAFSTMEKAELQNS